MTTAIKYELTSTCDDAGNMLAARLDDPDAVRVVESFDSIVAAQAAKDRLLKWYASKSVPVGDGCLSIRQSD